MQRIWQLKLDHFKRLNSKNESPILVYPQWHPFTPRRIVRGDTTARKETDEVRMATN